MSPFLPRAVLVATFALAVSCGRPLLTRVGDGGVSTGDGGLCPDSIPVQPGAAGDGALRGCSSCKATGQGCSADNEYEVSVSCLPARDGGWMPANGVAGAWCYPSPAECGPRPTCDCLKAHGAFSVDGGLGLDCPGSYWSCFEGDVKQLHCNPP